MPGFQHILVVDDDWSICKTLREVLTSSGYRVSLVGDAIQARAALKRSTVDLMVADLGLFGESGTDLCRFAQTQGVRCLLMSGDILRRANPAEVAFPFIGKPSRLASFTERVREVLATPLEDRHCAADKYSDNPQGVVGVPRGLRRSAR